MLKQRLLVLTPRFPYPTIGGDRIRILHLCRGLSREFSLTLLSLCETRDEMSFEPCDGVFSDIHRVHLPRWRSYLNTLCALLGSRPLQLAYYESSAFRDAVHRLAPQHDLVIAHLIRTGQYIEQLRGPRILEMTDAISMNYQRIRMAAGNRNWKRLVYLVEQRRLQRYESQAVRRFDRVWLTSHVDRRFLDPDAQSPIDVIPNGTDLEKFPFHAPVEGGNTIVFIGNMASVQNQDACQYFIREVLPQVRARAPITFRIVGNAPIDVQRRFANYDGVEMTGRIADIRDGVNGAFCGVCPVRAAAGIQNKILEYLALGLPCVTSPVGLCGIDARPGEELLVYKNPAEAAEQILQLHSNAGLRMQLAVAGRELVQRRYDWQDIYRKFVASCISTSMQYARLRDAGQRGIASAA